MRGQITVFIILGIVLMAGMSFLLLVVSTVQEGQLQTSLDQTQSKLFRSESARLYIEDCLMDTLDDGLELLGKSGRLFAPYSRVEFQDGVNGVMYKGDQVFIAIKHEENDEPASYPCSSSSNAPAYCQWMREDKAAFGHRQKITLDLVESDLESYVRDDVYTCFQSMLEDGNEFTGEFDQGELSLDLQVESGGIVVTASYPLSMSVSGTEVFEIQDFDLFYPSNLYSFFNNAIVRPLYSEEKDVSYNYTAETLRQVSAYRILGANLEISEQGQYNVYEFTTNQIHRDEDTLVYRLAIENRPPALEYVSQAACLGYDYLILPDSRSYTNLTINLSAYDPDGDTFEYALDPNDLDIVVPESFNETPYYNAELDVADGVYEFIVSAFNDNGYDAQTVRVKVGETTDFTVSVTDVAGNEVDKLSVEEPYLVTVESDDGIFRSMDVSVNDEEKYFSWSTNKFCFVVPYMDSVECDDLSNYEEDMFAPFTDSMFQLVVGSTNIELGYDESLCGEAVDLSRGLTFDTYSCVYKEVPGHNFSYPYHEVFINSTGGHEERDNSPFNTTTSCCNPDDTLAVAGTVCYESNPVCVDKLQVVQRAFCDGTRGNVCGSDTTSEIQRSSANIALCGDTMCGVHELCVGQEQYSYQTDSEGTKYLCAGTYGCTQAIENPIVSSDRLSPGLSWRTELANTNVADLEGLGLYIGECKDGNSCDSNGNGILDGVCASGRCTG